MIEEKEAEEESFERRTNKYITWTEILRFSFIINHRILFLQGGTDTDPL